jgi:dTDP-4-amino-4,6-dideoxygalactose transaminase
VSSSIPFNSPPLTGHELDLIAQAIERRELSGDGHFTKTCEAWLCERLNVSRALLTHSCTAALEMAAMLAALEPGDEVIMPSYTFVSTANAVVIRGAVPVFVDIRSDTLNLDETLVEAAITPKTKAIFVVHYAGVCAEMDALREIANAKGLVLVEDAAQAILATYKGRQSGTLGDLACFSFHASKNVISGEGGALVVNQAELAERAEIVREKGTNRARFMLGLVDKYTWVDIGSSYVPSELVAAFLSAQLRGAEEITADRRAIWDRYHLAFAGLESKDVGVRRPIVPDHCVHNGHLYYLIMPDRQTRDGLIQSLRKRGVTAPFHYVPLHSSPGGQRFGRVGGSLAETDAMSGRLIRLPLWSGMTSEIERVVDCVFDLV